MEICNLALVLLANGQAGEAYGHALSSLFKTGKIREARGRE